jgi:hypothetical protein
MELDRHVDRILEHHSKLEAVRGEMHEAVVGHNLSALVKAELRTCGALGKAFLEITRLAPHIPEIYKLNKEHKKTSEE